MPPACERSSRRWRRRREDDEQERRSNTQPQMTLGLYAKVLRLTDAERADLRPGRRRTAPWSTARSEASASVVDHRSRRREVVLVSSAEDRIAYPAARKSRSARRASITRVESGRVHPSGLQRKEK